MDRDRLNKLNDLYQKLQESKALVERLEKENFGSIQYALESDNRGRLMIEFFKEVYELFPAMYEVLTPF